MKQRTSFILKGLVSLVLSLVMLCGTAVTSLSAVTVDLAETGAATQVTSLPLQNGDLVGSATSDYVLEQSGSGWKIKNGTNYVRNDYGTIKTDGTSSNATSFSVALSSNNSFQFSFDDRGNPRYLQYSNGSFSSPNWGSATIPVYRTPSSYIVTFHKNDGSNETTTQTDIAPNTDTTLTANSFTREGYTFIKWNTAANGSGISYGDKGTVNLSANLDLYAQWAENVTTDANIATIYFTNSHNGGLWSNVYAYAWNSADDTIKNADWPGESATYFNNNSESQGLYTYALDVSKYDSLVFTNNAGDQTENIPVDDLVANGYNGVYFKYDNSRIVEWYTYNYSSAPTITEVVGGTIDPAGNYYIGNNSGLYVLGKR